MYKMSRTNSQKKIPIVLRDPNHRSSEADPGKFHNICFEGTDNALPGAIYHLSQRIKSTHGVLFPQVQQLLIGLEEFLICPPY